MYTGRFTRKLPAKLNWENWPWIVFECSCSRNYVARQYGSAVDTLSANEMTMWKWNSKTKVQQEHDKANKMTILSAKTQISLCICALWSAFAVGMKNVCVLKAHSEDSYQAGQMRRLIWAFDGGKCDIILLDFVILWLKWKLIPQYWMPTLLFEAWNFMRRCNLREMLYCNIWHWDVLLSEDKFEAHQYYVCIS